MCQVLVIGGQENASPEGLIVEQRSLTTAVACAPPIVTPVPVQTITLRWLCSSSAEKQLAPSSHRSRYVAA